MAEPRNKNIGKYEKFIIIWSITKQKFDTNIGPSLAYTPA